MFLVASLEKWGEDLGGVDFFFFDYLCYFCCDGRGLASACVCEDQGRGLGVFDGLKLAWFQ
jgi:hypothetical protein